jgi:hypothetical protein
VSRLDLVKIVALGDFVIFLFFRRLRQLSAVSNVMGLGKKSTAPGIPRRSPNQVLARPDAV